MEGILALDDKSDPGLRQLPVVGGISALNESSDPDLRELSLVGGSSSLSNKSEPVRGSFPWWMAPRRSTIAVTRSRGSSP